MNVIEIGGNDECKRNRIKLMIIEIIIFFFIVYMIVMWEKILYLIYVKWVYNNIMYLCV